MLIREPRIFSSPFPTPSIYRDPFQRPPAYQTLDRHWLFSLLGQRHFIELVRRRLPSPLWPRSTFDAVVDAVADALIADVRARRRKDGAA